MKLELDGLTKEFGDFTAVNHINLTMTNGVYGLLGVNGAGKTTLMRMLCTLLKPTSGTICCNGKDIFSMDSEYRKLLGYLPQDFGFYPEFTVEDYLLYIAALKGIRPIVAKKRVKELIAKVGLSKAAHKKMKKLSGGMKRRAGIAQAMLNNPKILILDEPTVGLDPKQVTEIRALIKELGKEHTVILSSHILSEVSQICNRVIIINNGKIIAVDTPENLEKKVIKDNSVYVTVEDNDNKIETVKEKLPEVKEIKLVTENEDKTKKYIISAEKDVDLRKSIFNTFAKEGITIFEMKQADATLEDAFMQLISSEKDKKETEIKKENTKENKEKKEKKNKDNKQKEGGQE